MKQNSGHFVTISSIAALQPGIGMSQYAGTKAGLYNFHNSARLELKASGYKVSTSVVLSHALDTAMFKGFNGLISK